MPGYRKVATLFLKRFLAVLAIALAAVPLSACSAKAPLAVSDPTPPVYQLGVGDKVRVTVFGEEELTGEYAVGPDGSLALPLIGNIAASGRTPGELQADIADKLSPEYILDPRVSIDVLTYRPFYILGEVNKPGEYPYSADQLTVAQAVAVAGGFTYRANTKTVFIRHKDEQSESKYSIKDGKPVWVRPGDTIRIGERYF